MATSFTIKAPPGTDVWRKPPSTDVFNAPTASSSSSSSSSSGPSAPSPGRPLTAFHSARVSFRLPPTASLLQYDQAGLLLSLRPSASASTAPTTTTTTTSSSSLSSTPSPPKWLKSGVEIYHGVPRAATVACDVWADWSLSPVKSPSPAPPNKTAGSNNNSEDDDDSRWVTVAVENGTDELGKSLWVYQVVGSEDGEEEKVPLREVCWVFGHGAEWELTVEAYACRPSKATAEELAVEFRGLEVKWV